MVPLPALSSRFQLHGNWCTAWAACSIELSVLQDKKERETNGFKSRMGQNAPRPRLLRLRLEDGAKTKNANLTKGHFTWITEQGRQERWIVASCGNYTVLWNFRFVNCPAIPCIHGAHCVLQLMQKCLPTLCRSFSSDHSSIASHILSRTSVFLVFSLGTAVAHCWRLILAGRSR